MTQKQTKRKFKEHIKDNSKGKYKEHQNKNNTRKIK